MQVLFLIGFLLLPLHTSFGATTIPQFSVDVVSFINTTLIPLLLTVAFAVFVYHVVRLFIIGGNNSTNQEDGKRFMLYSVAAFVLIASLWGVVNLLAGGIGLTNTAVVCPDFLPDSYCQSNNTSPSFKAYTGSGGTTGSGSGTAGAGSGSSGTGANGSGNGSGTGGSNGTASNAQTRTITTNRDASPRVGDSAAAMEIYSCLESGSVFMTFIHGIVIDSNPATTTLSALDRYATLFSPDQYGTNNSQFACSPLREICYENLTVTMPDTAWTNWNGTQIPGEPFYATTSTTYNTSVITLAESIKRAGVALCE